LPWRIIASDKTHYLIIGKCVDFLGLFYSLTIKILVRDAISDQAYIDTAKNALKEKCQSDNFENLIPAVTIGCGKVEPSKTKQPLPPSHYIAVSSDLETVNITFPWPFSELDRY